ncbi:MAG: hypothetical protein JWO85_572 [Candidatus Eremiobacteraeota bacterium]|nr:hypothetical protein [Candidatus Eremiobacteraeota bacterium]
MKRAAICGVYAIVASDGREYIGSSRDIVTRVTGHRYALEKGGSPHWLLQAAWDQLGGGDAFEVAILERVADPADLAAAEQRHIDARDPKLNIHRLATRAGHRSTPDERRERPSRIPSGGGAVGQTARSADQNFRWHNGHYERRKRATA